jgi:hypothetical protein
MLHEFLTQNRRELINRCIAKTSRRDGTRVVSLSTEPGHGVPLFLDQLVDALRTEEANPASRGSGTSGSSPDSLKESTRTAALHGKALLDDGYTVDQVVHGYGDICQSITELAGERDSPVTVAEFHTLNRMLDNAIADAVTSYAHHHDADSAATAKDLHEQMGTLADELRLHVNIALKAMEVLQLGNVGVNGATGALVSRSLASLRDLIDKALPEIRLASGMTTPAKVERK